MKQFPVAKPDGGGQLHCTNTLVIDHGAKLVLRELVLEGPSGLTFP